LLGTIGVVIGFGALPVLVLDNDGEKLKRFKTVFRLPLLLRPAHHHPRRPVRGQETRLSVEDLPQVRQAHPRPFAQPFGMRLDDGVEANACSRESQPGEEAWAAKVGDHGRR